MRVCAKYSKAAKSVHACMHARTRERERASAEVEYFVRGVVEHVEEWAFRFRRHVIGNKRRARTRNAYYSVDREKRRRARMYGVNRRCWHRSRGDPLV